MRSWGFPTLFGVLMLLLWACGGEVLPAPEPTPTPVASPTATPEPEPAPGATAEPTLRPTPTVPVTPPPPPTPPTPPPATPVTPTSAPTTPAPAPAPTLALPLDLIGVRDGEPYRSGDEVVEATVGTTGFAVVGVTSPDAFVTVDGTPVLVDEQGLFVQSIGLLEGPNLASVVVSDFQGNENISFLLVLAAAPTEALPLHLLWPQDGVNVEDGVVTVIGVTPPDAIVTVNGEVVSVNVFGVFRVVLPLEEGPNIIEVIASDLLGNTATAQRTVVWVK